MSGTQLRSGKNLSGSISSEKSENKQPKGRKKTMCDDESAMSAEVMQELKSMRSELCGQMAQLSDRLSKIECVVSKIDEIDKIVSKVLQIEESAAEMKESLESLNTRVGELENKTGDSERLFQKTNQEFFTRIMNLERYSRDYNIRIIGVEEEEGEDCITILHNYLATLGFQDVAAEVENAHRTGKRNENGRPRHIIAKLYSRPFKRRLLQIAKTPDKKAMLNGVRFVEDFTHNDFEARKKALPIMQKAFEEGKKVKFTKGKLYVEGIAVPLM